MKEGVIVKTLGQLLEEPLPKTYYIVKPLLPVGGMLLIAGDVKTFKSYLALNLAYCLSCGKAFLDRFQVSKPLSVLYIEMEVGQYEVKERGNRIDSYHADPIAKENLHIVSKDMRIQFDTKEGIMLFHDACTKAQPDVVIIDPIVEFHSQDENSAIAMKSMLWPVRKMLKDEFNNCGLVIVHHTAKSSEFRPGNNPSSVRGSYLAGAANTILNLEKPVKDNDSLIRVNFTLRSDKAPRPVTLVFNEETGGFVER